MPSVNYQLSTVNCRVKPKGFTLIELLVVISILGILAALALASYGNAQAKSRDSRRKTDLDAIKKALELAKQDSPGAFYYPNCPSSASSCQLTNTTETYKYDASGPFPLHPTYIANIPTDPKLSVGYTYYLYGSDGTTACTTSCVIFKLVACLEGLNDTQRDSTTDPACAAGTVSYSVKTN